jgi:hypothetical protein
MADVNSQPSKPSVDAFTSLFLSPFRLLGSTAAPTTPAVTAYRQVAIEMVNLSTRRTQALMDVTAKTRQCKNTGDLANVTVEFWQTAWSQQIESANRIAALFGTPLPLALVSSKPAPVRDMLTVPETAVETSKPTSQTEWADQSKRRAA